VVIQLISKSAKHESSLDRYENPSKQRSRREQVDVGFAYIVLCTEMETTCYPKPLAHRKMSPTICDKIWL